MMEERSKTGFFEGESGLPIFYRCWKPAGTPRACLAIVPGNPDHSGRYQYFVQYFLERDFTIYAMDLRGTAHSGGRRAYVNSLNEYVIDIKLFLEMIAQTISEQRIFLIGHSYGGKLVLMYGMRFSQGLSGVIASSPCIRLQQKLSWIERLSTPVLAHLIPYVEWATRIDHRFTSHDQSAVEAYKNDDLLYQKYTTKLVHITFKDDGKLIKCADHFHLPCLLMHGGADQITSPAATIEFFDKIKVQDKTLKIYDGLYHELFNEIAREDVFNDMERWIERRI